MNKAEQVLELAQESADIYRIFEARRAGMGASYVNGVLDYVKFRVARQLGDGVVNQFPSQEKRPFVDFWLAEENALMQVEFTILNSPFQLERDVFNALMARGAGKDVRHLMLIGNPGSKLLVKVPAAVGIIEWIGQRHGIHVHIHDLTDNSASASVAV